MNYSIACCNINKKALDHGFVHCRGLCLCCFIFLFDGCAAFELYLDAVVVYDDLLDQLLDDRAVVCVQYVAALDVRFEGVEPRLDLRVSGFCRLQFLLLRLQFLHALAAFTDFHCVFAVRDLVRLLCLVQSERRLLYLDDLLFDSCQCCCVFGLHYQSCAVLDRCHDVVCVFDHLAYRCEVGTLQHIVSYVVAVACRSAVCDPVSASPV